ncbi:DUF4422 domain-containing protein [Campylobacter sp. LH-2024]|uniref:DUF4422 domain-containing protein n=1 Tax=Campylobacter sp. LH-2024 TaxID=3239825 RepID=UPI003AA7E5DA
MKENKPKIKILVGYHKPAVLIKNDVFVPIHLGRSLATEASKDGEMTKEDYEWMCENMIGDNIGDNISHLNRYLNELTGIYWAWKNYDQLGNPDYIGFMHYRRQLIFDENFLNRLELNGDGYSYLFNGDNKEYFEYIFSIDFLKEIRNNDLIIPKIFDCNFVLNKNKIFDSCKEFLYSWNGNYHTGYNILRLIFNSPNLQNFDFLNIIDNNVKYYPYNMFIIKKEYYFEYMNFLFNIIFEIYDIMKHDLSKRNNIIYKREIAWLSEYVSTLFFHYLRKQNKKILETNVSCGIDCFKQMDKIADCKKNNFMKRIRIFFEKI